MRSRDASPPSVIQRKTPGFESRPHSTTAHDMRSCVCWNELPGTLDTPRHDPITPHGPS